MQDVASLFYQEGTFFIGSRVNTAWSESSANIQILTCGTSICIMYSVCFLMKLNTFLNCSSSLSINSASSPCLPHFLYKWLSSVNPSFHDAIEKKACVQPRCSSVSRATMSWLFWRCGLNLPAFFLGMSLLIFNHYGRSTKKDKENLAMKSIKPR
jgi:hypothetical protein